MKIQILIWVAVAVGVAFGCEPGVKIEIEQGDSMTGWRSTSSETDTGSETVAQETDTPTSIDTSTVIPICGNGLLEVGEFCDDGNTLDSDGCYADCLSQDPSYDCSVAGQLCVLAIVCGNGNLETTEFCDEGEGNKTEGCSSDCKSVTNGWSCSRPGKPCVELPVCGDGVRSKGEQCDDDNLNDGDGCSAVCALEDGYFCIPGKPCVQLLCGDGNRTLDEDCDDGNLTDGDGCSATCAVEQGYQCFSLGCKPVCGDGLIFGDEVCDDGNRDSGDGCNVLCAVEPYYTCTADEPSVCTTTIVCGNGIVEPGEVCDYAIAEHGTCYKTGASACKGYENDLVDEPVCDNGIVEYLEECDGDGGLGGCSDDCEIEDGYTCPVANYCYWVPVCGDNIVQSGESCDVGAVTSLACDNCVVQDGWYCSGSPSNCVASVCQDGTRAPDEQCDDGNNDDGDGCSTLCMVETGWICPPGIDCITDCGNGELDGAEQCDDGNDSDNDGCTNCKVDPNYDCDTDGCDLTVCGDSNREMGEGCDDGNLVAGDGCGPTCQLEPKIDVGPDPTVHVVCGDGLKTSGEQCDDGNKDIGDGCDENCNKEPGWNCDDVLEYPENLAIKITYRDFMQRSHTGGHPHMKNPNQTIPYWSSTPDTGIVGAICTTSTTSNGSSCGRLDAAGKPVLDSVARNVGIYGENVATNPPSPALVDYNVAAFSLWYRDTNTTLRDANDSALIEIGVNPAPMPAAGLDTLQLTHSPDISPSAYVFQSDDNSFYPLGTTRSVDPVAMRGFECTFDPNDAACDTWGSGNELRNFHFTSELRYFFQYQGAETLTFFGDDDVWVFVNGRLAVDIGGIHSTLWGRVVLGDDGAAGSAVENSCSVHGAASEPAECELETTEGSDDDDLRFGLQKGGVYEIVVFQAERHPTDSNYRLTLDGFIAPRSNCNTNCGDDIVAGTELCDNGDSNVNGVYGQCNTSCEFTYCGDDEIQASDEACDNGLNVDPPWAPNLSAAQASCTGCEQPGYCGDGILQSSDEVCDDGSNDDSYGGCATDCKSLGGYCGDDTVDPGIETCDLGPDGLYVTYQADGAGCSYNCQQAPSCGDNIRNGPEQCDGTQFCDSDCQYAPRCGDGLVATDGSEECDFGDFASDETGPEVYGGCSTACELGPYCGDDDVFTGIEECDDGAANNDTTYDGCTKSCAFGPRCGDGVVQDIQGELCDNGYNEDTYKYVEGACGPNCTPVPYCGDGILQDDFEWCDNGSNNDDNTYNGCTSICEWGPYCGDGVVQEAFEVCDLGTKNAAYSITTGGCDFDCQPAPYCGDGVRNGVEECDNGTAGNLGGYGGCNANCSNGPFCGDYTADVASGEECDDGPIGSVRCTVGCEKRLTIVE